MHLPMTKLSLFFFFRCTIRKTPNPQMPRKTHNPQMPITTFQLPSLFSFTILLMITPSISCLPAQQPDLLATCLIHHNVTNFTTSHPPSTATNYHHLLHFSLHNLRFTDPRYPKPYAIILPDTKHQLSTCIICGRAAGLQILIRSGGHSYEGLSSVSDSGDQFVVIDMMNMNSVVVDMETKTAWVEGGATLGELYHAIAEFSSVHGFPGGSCPSVGVGGHVSGGGFGFLSRKYGLAADNVVDAVLVDADGRLIDRAAMGEDVFWAIRGGGGGVWGIIYAWKIKLLNVPGTLTAFMVSKSGRTKHGLAELVHKWQLVAPRLDDLFYLSATVGAALPEAKGSDSESSVSVTFRGLFLGPKLEASSIIDYVIPELGMEEDDYLEMNWIDSVLYFSGLAEGSTVRDLRARHLPEKNHFKAKSDYVRVPISVGGIRAILDMLEEEPKGYLILDPYGGAMDRRREDAIAFPHRRGNLFNVQYLVSWTEDDADCERCRDWIRRIYLYMEQFVSSNPRASYVNYLDLDLGVEYPYSVISDGSCGDDAVKRARASGERYFLGNYGRLVWAKTIIDPCNVFRHQQGIRPLPGRCCWKAEYIYGGSNSLVIA